MSTAILRGAKPRAVPAAAERVRRFDTLLLVIALAYPMFRGLLAGSQLPLLVSTASCALFAFRNVNLRMSLRAAHAVWLLLGVFAVGTFLVLGGSRSLNSSRLLLFVDALLLFFTLSGRPDWLGTVRDVLLAMLLVNAAATILLFVVPGVYDSFVKPRFFAGNSSATGYESGLTSHYSYNGVLMAAGLLLSFSKMVAGDAPRKGRGWAPVAVFVAFALALLLTTKRAPLVCALVGLAVAYFTFSGRLKFRSTMRIVIAIVVAAVAIAVVAQFVPAVGGTFERIMDAAESDSMDSATSNRTWLWEHAVELWGESPVFGNGWGTYRFHWPGATDPDAATITAHNIYLNLLAEGGVVGLVLFLVSAAQLLHLGRVACSSEALTRGDRACLATFSLGYQVFFLAYGLFGAPLYDAECYFVYFALAAASALALSAPRDGGRHGRD